MTSNLKDVVRKVAATMAMATTVMSLSGFAALAPLTAHAVAPADYGLKEGDTIRATGDIDIYIVNQFGYKRLFVNPAIFNLYGHLGWNKVVSVSPATRDAFVTSGLFRNCETNDQKVYGLEVNSEDTATLHWVNVTGAQAVAQDPNFFQKVFCINTNEQNLYQKGSDYSSLSQIPNYARGQVSGNVPPSGPLSVGLASDNPAANTIISGQAAADLAHFTFSGSGTVTSLTLQRLGVSADTSLTNVYLYQGAKRLTDAATVSQGIINFNNPTGLFMVSGSTTISVKADIATGLSGQTVGVELTGYNGTSAMLNGNLMSIASAPSDFSTVTMNDMGTGTATSALPSANNALTPQNDLAVWQDNVSVNNHDVWLKSLQLRVIGSVYATDLQNFRLQVDGVTVGSAIQQVDSNFYIAFDLTNSPVKLQTGTRQIRVLANVVNGSGRNFYLSLRQKPDIYVVESQYNQPVLVSATTPVSSQEQDIAAGDITFTKTTDSASGDIVTNSSGASLGKFTVTAQGEAMKIESLNVTFKGNVAALSALRNAALFVDGSQVGSTTTLWADNAASSNSAGTNYTLFNLGSSFIVQPGTPRTLEVKADIFDNNGTNNAVAGNTIQLELATGSSNVQRLTSLNYVGRPSGTISANVLTIRTGSLSVAKNTAYANQFVVVPQQQYRLGSFVLTEGSTEDVNVNTINVDFINNTGGFTTSANNPLQNVFLKIWNDTGSLVAQTTAKSTVSYTASNSYSVNFTIPKTKTYTVDVYGDMQSTGISNGNNVISNLSASGLTTSSSTSVTAADVSLGQTIQAQGGSLNLANGSNPADRLINGGQQVTAYAFTLQPQYDNFTVDELGFNLGSALASSSGAVGMVYVYDGTTLVGSAPMASGASVSLMSGLNYPISQSNGTKTLTVQVKTNSVGVGANDTQGIVQVRLSHVKYHSSNGTVTTSVVDPTAFKGNSNYVVASYPTFTNASLPSTVLAAGTQTLYQTSIGATGGAGVQWKRIKFTINKTANPTITESSLKIYENGVDISSFGTIATGSNSFTSDTGVGLEQTNAGSEIVTFTLGSGNERTIPAGGSITLALKGTVGGNLIAGQSITAQVANPAGSTPGNASVYNNVAATGSFIWSDQSAAGHSLTTGDWMDDGLVQTLGQSESLYQ